MPGFAPSKARLYTIRIDGTDLQTITDQTRRRVKRKKGTAGGRPLFATSL
ncbi:hypothetical protein OAF45_01535 [Candidatus Latescibacteria bacterium]|nr:hypothetical protein [Candidatus Latescibacterota bacterium]